MIYVVNQYFVIYPRDILKLNSKKFKYDKFFKSIFLIAIQFLIKIYTYIDIFEYLFLFMQIL